MQDVHTALGNRNGVALTYHAWERMGRRGLSPAEIADVMSYGREVHVRGATVFVVGRKEVARYRRDGLDLSAIEGVHVVCSEAATIMTAYCNRDMRGLREFSRRPCRRYGR